MLKVYEKEALEAIKDFLNMCKSNGQVNPEYLYHHNTGYQKVPQIIDHGILSKKAYYDMIGEDVPDNLKIIVQDECVANGLENVSVSQSGMTDLYRDEFEYDPTSPYLVDILLAKELNPSRHTINYGNEFLARYKISQDMFRAIDIRLLELIKDFESNKYGMKGKEGELAEIIDDFNQLKIISLKLITHQIDIPLREMSNFELTLDKEMVSQLPTLILKK